MSRFLALPRRFTAALAATAIALGGMAASTAPASASDRDLLKFLAGAATIAIIAKGVSDHNRRNQAQAAPLPQPVHPDRGRPGNHRPPHVAPVRLPQECGSRYRVRGHGVLTYYGERCLQRSGIHTAALPASCRQQVQTNRGPRPAFQGACLQQAGYRTAQR
jgi:hypothetical protein